MTEDEENFINLILATIQRNSKYPITRRPLGAHHLSCLLPDPPKFQEGIPGRNSAADPTILQLSLVSNVIRRKNKQHTHFKAQQRHGQC